MNSSKKPENCSESSQIVSIEKLLPGDVLLHRPITPDFIQKKIQNSTASPYTHASIYLGDHKVAEASIPLVQKTDIVSAVEGWGCVGVLRSQCGFGGERPNRLNDFINELVNDKTPYDFSGVRKFSQRNKQFFENQLEEIKRNYGTVKQKEDFLSKPYFCSALIVACFSVVGIIGDSAQVAYPPEVFSPADIHRDVTFGWFLGHIIPDGGAVQKNDPLLKLMSWHNVTGPTWWS